MPRSASQSAAKRAESDLSVSPISTCFTSLVIRGSASPAAAAASGGKIDDLGQVGHADRSEPCHDGSSEPVDVRLLGIGPLRDGDEVDLAAVEPVGHDRASRPRARRRSTVCCGRQVERSVLLRAGRAPEQKLRPVRGDLEDLRTPVAAQEEPARPRGLAWS